MKNHTKSLTITIIVSIALSSVTATFGVEQKYGGIAIDPEDVTIGKKEYSPHLDQGYPQRVFWGDTHLHSSYSTDAGMIGNRLGPDAAYRFARGEEVVSSTGVRAKLVRPLDFLVIADHAENLGLAPMIMESNPDLLRIPWGKKVHDMVKQNKPADAYAAWGEKMTVGDDPIANKAIERNMWARLTSYAEEYNQPGVFTAIIGYEWTSSPGAAIFTVMFFFAMAKPKPILYFLSATMTRLIPRICGNGWMLMKRKLADAFWPFHIMAIYPMA